MKTVGQACILRELLDSRAINFNIFIQYTRGNKDWTNNWNFHKKLRFWLTAFWIKRTIDNIFTLFI